jgi:hypothetical protein
MTAEANQESAKLPRGAIVEKATSTYRAIISAVEERRLQLGWPMWKLDDVAGSQDGHYAKCLYPDTASGRQAQWRRWICSSRRCFPTDSTW